MKCHAKRKAQRKRHSVVVVACCCFLACYTIAQNIANDPEKAVLPQPCAKDPVYQDFEKVQAYAYVSDKDFNFRLLLDPDFQSKVQNGVVNEMKRRSGQSFGNIRVSPDFVADFQAELAHLNVPTCYEIPAIYFMIEKYADDVETARRQLGLPLPQTPRFGSLPSNDINAYTYPSPSGAGEVIAINYQLFNFIYRLTELSVHGVSPNFDTKKHTDAEMITQGLLNITYNPQAKDAFAAATVGLLLGRPIPKERVSPSEEPLVAFFAGSMERFVFAHEYGHIIKNHVSDKMPLPAGAAGTRDYEVFRRNWRQEFEADSIGLQLIIQILVGSAEENPDVFQDYIYALKAPLFFFDALDLLDRARFMDENGVAPPKLQEAEKSRLRACADNAMRGLNDSRCLKEMPETHPPAWLRKERIRNQLQDSLVRLPHSAQIAAALQKADEVIFSLDWFTDESTSRILDRLNKENSN